ERSLASFRSRSHSKTLLSSLERVPPPRRLPAECRRFSPTGPPEDPGCQAFRTAASNLGAESNECHSLLLSRVARQASNFLRSAQAQLDALLYRGTKNQLARRSGDDRGRPSDLVPGAVDA